MSWSIILATLREVAEENIAAAQRRVERASQKKKEEEGKKQDDNKQEASDVSGGVLAMHPKNAADESNAKESLEREFQILLRNHKSFLTSVFRDAKAFGAVSDRRPKETVERYLSSPKKSKQPVQGQGALFAQNLWPQLKNRGWKVEQVNSGGDMVTRYSYGSETVSGKWEYCTVTNCLS